MRTRIAKILFVATLAPIMIFGLVSSAAAGGWWKENANDTINEVANNGGTTADVAEWNLAVDNSGAASPHGSFVTTTNKCKTCHAVHGALSDSFRLLKNTDRSEECNYCHMGPAGASDYRLYTLDDLGFSVKGEHSLGSTHVPDSDINGGSAFGYLPDRGGPYDGSGKQVLYCYSCHSVHGANTIQNAGNAWKRKILRIDPADNGSSADNGARSYQSGQIWTREDGATVDLATLTDVRLNALTINSDHNDQGPVKAAFCGDCHNRNYNFRLNIEFDGFDPDFGVTQVTGQDWSLTRGSHPMNDNTLLEVGGGAGDTGEVQVSNGAFNVEWCGECHSANDVYSPIFPGGDADWGTGYQTVGFPHQSKSNKLLDESITSGNRDATQTNDAYEPIDNMDEVCLICHDGKVGVTF